MVRYATSELPLEFMVAPYNLNEKRFIKPLLDIENKIVAVNISGSSWRNCNELRSSKIGKWTLKNGYASWLKGEFRIDFAQTNLEYLRK